MVCQEPSSKIVVHSSTTKLWGKICKILGMNKRMSSLYHPRIDGQAERRNRTLKEMLRPYVG